MTPTAAAGTASAAPIRGTSEGQAARGQLSRGDLGLPESEARSETGRGLAWMPPATGDSLGPPRGEDDPSSVDGSGNDGQLL
jgi:hypothetical protein